ncbi:MAG: hypothetical protein Q8S73_00900 [Deltaproteobacteria bacterium]|nr:hypothetical protein [Myxococcales bacterium]MDP3212632.1 hypothetical protein [Deltaproteobacteria bacterium]
MSDATKPTGMIARNEVQRDELVTRWAAPVAVGATLLCQPDEQVVIHGGGRALNVLTTGRFTLDPSALPFLEAFVDPSTGSLGVTLFFVSVGRRFDLVYSAPLGRVEDARTRMAMQPVASGRCVCEVSEALHVVDALVALGPGADAARLRSEWSTRLGFQAKQIYAARLALTAFFEMVSPRTSLDTLRLLSQQLPEVLLPAGVAVVELPDVSLWIPDDEQARFAAKGTRLPPLVPPVTAIVTAAPPPSAHPDGASLVGPVAVSSQTPSGDVVAAFHDDGVPLVVVDASVLTWWRGAQVGDLWVLRRQCRVDVGAWPETGWIFRGAAEARAAYQRTREHLRRALPGATARDVASESPRLDPDGASAEVFVQEGAEVAWISCDRTTDALTLAQMADPVTAFELGGARTLGLRGGAGRVHVATVRGADGQTDGVILGSFRKAPGDVMAALRGGPWSPVALAAPLTVDAPTGTLVLLWGAVAGAGLFGDADRDAVLARLQQVLGAKAAAEVSTARDLFAGDPVCRALRVFAGTYEVTLYAREEDGATAHCAVLTHPRATAWRPGPLRAPAPKSPLAGLLSDEDDGDDPEVFPGERYPRFSDYARLMAKLKAGAEKPLDVLAEERLEPAVLGAVVQRWMGHMTKQPALMPRLMRQLR